MLVVAVNAILLFTVVYYIESVSMENLPVINSHWRQIFVKLRPI